MLAIPVATISRSVWESSHEACTSAFRPRPSGIHSAPYPRFSTRVAKAAAAEALMPSIPTQTPSLPISIADPSSSAHFSRVQLAVSCPQKQRKSRVSPPNRPTAHQNRPPFQWLGLEISYLADQRI